MTKDTVRQVRMLGRSLHDARRASNLSQLRLSRMLGISRSSLSAYENGRNQIPIDVIIHAQEILRRNLLAETDGYGSPDTVNEDERIFLQLYRGKSGQMRHAISLILSLPDGDRGFTAEDR